MLVCIFSLFTKIRQLMRGKTLRDDVGMQFSIKDGEKNKVECLQFIQNIVVF